MRNALVHLKFPELFFGFVSPVGVETGPTLAAFSQYFRDAGYDVINIKVSDYFQNIKRSLSIDLPLRQDTTDQRISSYINFGNKVRWAFDDNSALAGYTIFRIMKERDRRIKREGNVSYEKRVYLLHQFKRKEEIELLRLVYGRLFFQVSVYSNKESRINYLSHKLAHERQTADQSKTKSIAHDLVAQDENEQENKHGQQVGKIFHDADLVINADQVALDAVEGQVFRFCELLFSANNVSPSKQEYGMFAAKAAALRTLDLSRQVGAAIFHPSGEIITMGSNEVPKAGGGTYWSDGAPFDAREYTLHVDSNDVRKRELLFEIFKATKSSIGFEDFLDLPEVKDSQFMDALEYGRIVHAEMSAISDAARLGLSVHGATLFCTTFPCHMCAKHIVASGITTVIFLEPYPKSLAADLHTDSIEIEGGSRGKYKEYDSVKFVHFFGITPRRYRELFERGSRKNLGKFLGYINNQKKPNLNIIAPFYVDLELRVVRAGTSALDAVRERVAAENAKCKAQVDG